MASDGAVVGQLPQAGNLSSTSQVAALNQLGTSFDLMQGMTAGYGVNDGFRRNPPYLPMSTSTVPGADPYGGNPHTAPNRVGVLRNAPNAIPGGKIYEMFFLYNPNQIGVSFSTNPDMLPPQYIYGTQGASENFTGASGSDATNKYFGNSNGSTDQTLVANITQGQKVSWDLLFDRTYDMTYGPNPAANRGVLKDVAALYNLMGTFLSNGAVPISTPVQVVFGQTNLNSSAAGYTSPDSGDWASGVSANSGELWGFTGFITSASIQYGIFRSDMIPSRCTISLEMTTVYVGGGMNQSDPNSTTLPGPGNVSVPNGTAAGRSLAIQAAEQAANQQGPPVVAPKPQPSGGL